MNTIYEIETEYSSKATPILPFLEMNRKKFQHGVKVDPAFLEVLSSENKSNKVILYFYIERAPYY